MENKRIVKIFSVSCTIGIVLAVVAHFFVMPFLANVSAQQKLRVSDSKNIVPVNSSIVNFNGETKIEGINSEQKALSINGSDPSTPGFVFSNGEKAKYSVDIYVDLGSQQSRDFLLLNKNNFSSLILNDSMQLTVYVVPDGSAFSIYAAEALSEVIYTSPHNAWESLFEIARLSASLDTNKVSDIPELIATVCQKMTGTSDVSKESIVNGTFFSWLFSVTSHTMLQSNISLPAIVKNGSLINTENLILNNGDEVRRVLKDEK